MNPIGNSFRDAMLLPDANQWKYMDDRIKSIKRNITWTLIKLPPNTKTLDSKWVLKKEYETDGSVDKSKTMSVLKGFKQKD